MICPIYCAESFGEVLILLNTINPVYSLNCGKLYRPNILFSIFKIG